MNGNKTVHALGPGRPCSPIRSKVYGPDNRSPLVSSSPCQYSSYMDEEGYVVTLNNKRARFTSEQEQLFEVGVFLFLIVPSMILAYFAVQENEAGFLVTALSIIVRDLSLLSLILFFLWRNAEPLTSIGWKTENIGREVIIGIALFPFFFIIMGLVGALLQGIGFTLPQTPAPEFLTADNIPKILVASILVVVVAVVEETIFRGYLVLRFLHITKSGTWAVLVSAVIFALGHGYEGSAGVGAVGIMGIVFAVIYLWRRSLVAPMVIHFLQNFMGIVLAPLLSMAG